MNKKAFALACFKVTQELARTGKIPENRSAQHALERGEALAKLALAIASERRVRSRAFGSPQHKAARTRTVTRVNELAHSSKLGRHFNLNYGHDRRTKSWPEAVFNCGITEFASFRIPDPNDY